MEWISVEDRLPDDPNECVLATHICAHGLQTAFTAFCSIRGYTSPDWAIMYAGHVNDVTHWQPLPDPPEVDK